MTVIHYRVLNRDTPTINIFPLHEAIKQIMSGLNGDVYSRIQHRNDNMEVVINTYISTQNFIFAEFLRMEPGASFNTVRAGNNQLFSISQHSVEQGETPLKSILYALVYGDNVLFVTKKDRFSPKCLEEYLTWLLRQNVQILAADRNLILRTRQLDSHNMRANSLNVKLPSVNSDSQSTSTIRRRVDIGLDLLKKFFSEETDIQAILADGEIDIEILLKFKNGRKNREINIGNIEDRLRNIDAEDIEDITYNGPDGKANSLMTRLQGQKNITMHDGVYDLTDARDKLLEQFIEWQGNGYMDLGEY